jgi:hypothetical protein
MTRRKSAAAVAVEENAIEENSILSPIEVPEQERDAYWNGLLSDLDLLRASIATIEFFPLLRALPRALWEKRVLVYLYRTSPKVKNQAGDRAYIEKISRPFDEDYIKENHGGGSYIAYLNLDRETQLKQTSFSIDGPPKLLPGQTIVDQAGNVLPMPQTRTVKRAR